MRSAIGGTWLFQIVIVFIFLFTGYICLSVNHSKAFAVKDDIIETIERHNGITLSSVTSTNGDINIKNSPVIKDITERLKTVSYRTSGNCNRLPKDTKTGSNACTRHSDWIGFDRQGAKNNTNASYCIKEISVSCGSEQLPSIKYYKVAVFYQLDLPVLSSVFSFTEKGDTKLIYNYSD